MKKTILNWCVKQVTHNLRNLDAHQLCELKYKLHVFNCSRKQWDLPNVRKAKQ